MEEQEEQKEQMRSPRLNTTTAAEAAAVPKARSPLWKKLGEKESTLRMKVRTMAAMNSKYDAIKKAKDRFADLKQDHRKLLEADFSEMEEDMRSCAANSNQAEALPSAASGSIRGLSQAASGSLARGTTASRSSFDSVRRSESRRSSLDGSSHGGTSSAASLPRVGSSVLAKAKLSELTHFDALAIDTIPASPSTPTAPSWDLAENLVRPKVVKEAPPPPLPPASAFGWESLEGHGCLPAPPLDPFLDGDDVPEFVEATDLTDAVRDLKAKFAESKLPPVVDDFDNDVAPTQALTIAAISADQVKQRKLRAEAERLAELRKRADDFARRELDLAWREDAARKRLIEIDTQASEKRARQRAADHADARKRERDLARQFTRATEALTKVVETHRGAIVETFGNLTRGSKIGARRYRVNWDLLPRPIELRLHCVRAVKDRLPRGKYVALISMEERLGGKPLKWSKVHSYTGGGFGAFPAVTKPVTHKGRFFDVTLQIQQSVFALCPSRRELQPGNVLVLEIFRLADKKLPRDVVVGWTALPVCDPHFRVCSGKFKLPVLRGPVDRSLDRFSSILNRVHRDLASWLGNAYVEVRHLPRETIDEKNVLKNEHHVEYDFVNKLLHLPASLRHARDKTRKAHDLRAVHPLDGEQQTPLSTNDVAVLAEEGRMGTKSWWDRRHTIFNRRGSKERRELADKLEFHGPSSMENDDAREREPFFLSHVETSQIAGKEVVDSIHSRRRETGARYDSKGLACEKNFTVHVASADDELNHDSSKSKLEWWSDVRDPETARQFGYAMGEPKAHVKPPTTAVIAGTKLKFMWQELIQDLGPDERTTEYAPWWAVGFHANRSLKCVFECKSADKLLRKLVFVGAFWLRVYVHYLAQWLLLGAFRVAIYGFRTQVYAIEFKYSPSRLTTLREVAVVATGPLGVIFTFGFFAVAGRVYRCLTRGGNLPVVYSAFMAAYALACIFDPYLVLVIDVATGNYNCDSRDGCREDYTAGTCRCFEGDAFKLWRRMTDDENGGIVGVFYCGIIYLISTLVAVGATFAYLMTLHENGRVYDTYCRIHGQEEDFTLPDDYELSIDELHLVVAGAKRYKGPLDQRRLVQVAEFETTDSNDPAFSETHVRVLIYEIQLDGARWVHRQFIRAPNGLLRELFGASARAVDKAFDGKTCKHHDILQDLDAADASVDRNPVVVSAQGDDDQDRDPGCDKPRSELRGFFAGLPTLSSTNLHKDAPPPGSSSSGPPRDTSSSGGGVDDPLSDTAALVLDVS